MRRTRPAPIEFLKILSGSLEEEYLPLEIPMMILSLGVLRNPLAV
jgi:hypothetical protein